MLNLLLNIQDFKTDVLPVVRIVLVVIVLLASIALIVTTLLQSSADENGATALSGQESYYSQNKGASRDGKLKKATIITACIMVVAIVLYFVTWIVMGK